jgi:glycosyltransferase involved in cell wall biosynthesis
LDRPYSNAGGRLSLKAHLSRSERVRFARMQQLHCPVELAVPLPYGHKPCLCSTKAVNGQQDQIHPQIIEVMMEQVKRVAYIGAKGLPAQAGVDRVVEAIVERVDKRVYQPVVYVSSRVVPAGTVVPGIELIRIHTLPGKKLAAVTLFLFAALHCLFLGNYAFVHLHNVEASYVLPFLRLRYKVISTSHGATHVRDKWSSFSKFLFKLSEAPFIYFSNIITCVAEPLTQRYERIYKRKVHFVANGIELEDVDEAGALQVLKERNVAPGEYILFAAGRIIATKGCHTLLKAYRQLETDKPLLIVGNIKHIPEYEQLLHELADERVQFISFLPLRETVLGLVRHCGLFVFPSTYEGMSMMLLEVLSLNVPYIASDIPENTIIVREEELLFKSDDVESLRDKLAWALAHPTCVTELAQKSYEFIEANYHWDDIVKEYEQLYAQLA